MVNNDDDGLWDLLKINMNMRVYRERQRRDRGETRIVFLFWLIPIVEKGLEGDLIQSCLADNLYHHITHYNHNKCTLETTG